MSLLFAFVEGLVPVQLKSSVSGPSTDGPEWYDKQSDLKIEHEIIAACAIIPPCFGHSNVEIAATSDGKTIVCYHPSADIPYEFTQVRDYQRLKCLMTVFVSRTLEDISA